MKIYSTSNYIFSQILPQKAIRYTKSNGIGLLNNIGLNRDRLTDDEEFELIDLMDLELQQPFSNVSGIFYFTEEGDKKHSRMIELLKKASIIPVIRTEVFYTGDPIWESDDGQISLDPSQIL